MGQNKIFTCEKCGVVFNKWQGKCSGCNAWNTLTEEILNTNISKHTLESYLKNLGDFSSLNKLEYNIKRIDIKIVEMNRLLGGGLVRGSAILISGEPGVGKSTLILELCNKLAKEESISQIKLRADRLNITNKHIIVANIISLKNLLVLITKTKPSIIVIDSIQTLHFDKLDSHPVSVSQVRTCAQELIQISKKNNITLFFIGHITKEGQIAGPKILEHIVDVVLSFEGENTQQFRIVRATKNRYGCTNEIALFEMALRGLREVKNPSEIFLPYEDSNVKKQGSCIFPSINLT